MKGVLTIVIGIILLAGCAKAHKPGELGTKENPAVAGSVNGMYTARHDGHLWVIYRGTDCVHFEHHPDCPCKKDGTK